ncbi:hypothetical protein HPP92_024894 [Vanilla planifolia]|uniref:Cytochrome P450 n=1 Tax=Vanilla planifolia TaxID=51239 RepID=A0A835PGV6_VANPL|nr:hypothetical protein HPP92_024894 [Vanilla planifolia]
MPIFLAGVLLASLCFFFWRRRKGGTNSKENIPISSPPKLPFIGNLHQLGSIPHRALYKLAVKHGPLMLLHLGSFPTVVVSSSKLAEEFMRNHDHCFASRPRLKAPKFMLYGCKDLAFAPYGEYWRQLRKLCVSHLLSSKMVQSFAPLRAHEVSLLLKKFSAAASENGAVSVTEALNSFTNAVLCRAVFGNSMKDEMSKLFPELVRLGSRLMSELYIEDYFPALGWLDVLFGLEGKLKRYSQKWDGLLETMLDERTISTGEGRDRAVNFVDTLLELQKDPTSSKLALAREHIKAILLIMIGAGIDTSFVILDWTMTELMCKPNIMRKVQEEIREIVKGEELVKEEHLSKTQYLKAIIKEVLRLHPPAPLLLPRESMLDCQIHNYEIPKNTRIIINAWAISRDSENWEFPEEFKPERFINCDVDYKGNNFEYIPFGAGRRICPGMQFATTTIELALANLLCFFDWKFPDGIRKEDMDMTESIGITCSRKKCLELVPIVVKLN